VPGGLAAGSQRVKLVAKIHVIVVRLENRTSFAGACRVNGRNEGHRGFSTLTESPSDYSGRHTNSVSCLSEDFLHENTVSLPLACNAQK
jgi:hypothetical protein